MLALAALLPLTACRTLPPPAPQPPPVAGVIRVDYVDQLSRRPDFPAAAQCAPDFVSECFRVIQRLELILELKGAPAPP